MREPESTATPSVWPASRFELAPPRRFVLPAVLLLLSEQPGHGYSLEKGLREFRFGQIDRPTVYRALAHLEADGLVESWSEARKAAQARRVYRITPVGERVLGVWMSVIKDERDSLGLVMRRYQATGTTDAMLAEVEGGWGAALGSGWSPVSPTAALHRHANPFDADCLALTVGTTRDALDPDGEGAGEAAMTVVRSPADEPEPDEAEAGPGPEQATAGARSGRPAVGAAPGRVRVYRLVPDRSVTLIEVRSTVGPISFGGLGLAGSIEAHVDDGGIRVDTPPVAHLEIPVDGLRSGNALYDAELMRRVDARRFPVAWIDLENCVTIGSGNRCRLAGQLTFHGVTRPVAGTVDVAVAQDGRLVVTGEQAFDIRDFAIPSPTMLMLRIYPDVRVRLQVEAAPEER